ncbi:MAG: GNAT family N-acetyltransferase [Eubacteriales bacterium]|nr:GNAT family N-acetyltransferase [Eubacteriales bacterium]
MNVVIRRAVQEDNLKIRPLQTEIARLHHEGKPELFKAEPRFHSEEAFAGMLADPEHFIFIAEADGRVVGYAFAFISHVRNHPTYIDFDRFYIDDICVLEECRGRGVGRRLFEACREQAQKTDCKVMDLGVFGFNTGAIAFYEACGMTEQQRRMEIVLR